MNSTEANTVLPGIARRLVMDGALEEDAARLAITEARLGKVSLTQWIQDKRLVNPTQLADASASEFGIALMDISALNPSQQALNLVSDELIQKHRVFPLFKRGKNLYIGIYDPTKIQVLDEIKFHTNLVVEPILLATDQLNKALENWRNTPDALTELSVDALESLDINGSQDETGFDAKNDDAPMVNFINNVLVEAIRRGASDIHFEPYENQYRVRLRIDGILKQVTHAPPQINQRIAARLKVMGQLDIAERRIPQDGRIKLNLSHTQHVDFRISTLPTLFGEKVVLRILDATTAKLGVDKLGYEPDQKKLFLEAIHKPYGLVLVTGPTGSGKTVSLYTALSILNDETRNISTAEDPVEIRLPGINQVQQNSKRGMTFAAALRSFLRQDPDVIMVGEIRDLETAEIAIKAAQTGHMVLSTLHTNDAPQTITRLMNMGIAPYNITSSVTLVIAQRLARRLCSHCKQPHHLPSAALLAEGFSQADLDQGLSLYQAVGCDQCTQGYAGRVGIYQALPMTDQISNIVLSGGSATHIAEAALRAGVRDLRQSALWKVKQGLTSLAEINRVIKT